MNNRLRTALSFSATWLRGDAWRESTNRVEDLMNIEFYIDLAQRAEAARIDFILKPDALGVDSEVLRRWPGFTSIDPVVMLSSIAAATSRIGLVPTLSARFTPPYLAARTVQSLDAISHGRAGLNLVMGLRGWENFGQRPPEDSAADYARAHEYVDVLRALWRSYPAEAILAERASGHYADPMLVRPIDFDGDWYSVRGPIDVPAHSDGAIPLIQAGGSPAGQYFAARCADVVFGAAPTIDDGLTQQRALRSSASEHGRDVLFMPGLSVHVAPTRAGARAAAERTAAGGRGAAHWNVVGTPDDVAFAIAERAQAGGLDGFIILPGSLSSLELMLDEVLPRLAGSGLVRREYGGSTLAEHLRPQQEGADGEDAS